MKNSTIKPSPGRRDQKLLSSTISETQNPAKSTTLMNWPNENRAKQKVSIHTRIT